jgi:hypothetical protein
MYNFLKLYVSLPVSQNKYLIFKNFKSEWKETWMFYCDDLICAYAYVSNCIKLGTLTICSFCTFIIPQ